MATKKPARLTRRAALAAAGAGAATALGALLTPAQAATNRPTVRRTPYNRHIYCKTALHSCSAVFPLDAAGITRTTVRKTHHR